MAGIEPLVHSAEGIGPASEPVSLADFRKEATQRDVTAVPTATEDSLAALSPNARRMLSRRLDVRALRETADSVLRIGSHRVDMEHFQRARLLAGSEAAEAIAHAQNLLLGPEKIEPLIGATTTPKRKRRSSTAPPPVEEDEVRLLQALR